MDGYDGGSFTRVATGTMKDVGEYGYSNCSAYQDDSNPNLFVSEGCYHYLHAWIDSGLG